jgi:hypothetical protein
MLKRLMQLILVLTLFGVRGASAGGDEIVVIVNKDNPATTLGQSDLRPIFQTTKTEWPNGSKVLPLNLPEADAARLGFDAAVLGLDPDRVARYWVDRKIRGGNPPPKKIPSGAMVVKLVAAKAEAVGYANASEVDKSVKIVARIRGGQVVNP